MDPLSILSPGYLIESWPGRLLKPWRLGPIPRDSYSIDLKWGPGNRVFEKPPLPGDSNAQSLRPTHLVEKVDIHQKTEWDIFARYTHNIMS